ncbi:hypothetical protein DRT92_25015 [Salmonella enterica subsp. enterica serovar Newport]|nr:hypothetical protein [Salmonella enterica subsp. enterica serovar Newport]ECA8783279.1 hypothetical protein [Salmonella enterica subsp. enterica serovar Newport]ECD2007384.1 hypothetical protein [Salmonella enterica subsp. enterica serovar Newport]
MCLMKCGYLNGFVGGGFTVIPENKGCQFLFVIYEILRAYFMKKTLIALAAAASAVVSGSAMAAWVDTGTGGVFKLEGTLTPKDRVTPWEANIFPALTALNANIGKGTKLVEIPFSKNVPVVSVRNREAAGFRGRDGSAALVRISFGNAVNLNSVQSGRAPLQLRVVDAANSKELGTLTAPLFVGGLSSWGNYWKGLYASSDRDLFWGGLPLERASAAGAEFTLNMLTQMSPEITEKYGQPNANFSPSYGTEDFGLADTIYKAVYGAGFLKDDRMAITLNAPLEGDAPVNWKAELPITISYS